MDTGVVLAGGEGRRFGGDAPKALAPYRGRPLVAWALDALRPHCDEVLVMGGAHAAALSRVAEGARVLADPGGGPHVALRLAARVAGGDRLLVAPADAPRLTPAVYAALLAAGSNAAAVEGAGVNPLVASYDRRALLALGEVASLQAAVRALGSVHVRVEGDLRDADTRAALAELGLD